jgi:hypothetical protein
MDDRDLAEIDHHTRDAVRAYDAASAEREWARLELADDGPVEFALHTRSIARWLPPPSPGVAHRVR